MDDKIRELEARLNQSEQSYSLVNKKGDASAQFLNEVYQKMEHKLMQLEQGISLVRLEQGKDKENVGRLEVNNLKNSEEFRGMVG